MTSFKLGMELNMGEWTQQVMEDGIPQQVLSSHINVDLSDCEWTSSLHSVDQIEGEKYKEVVLSALEHGSYDYY